MSQLERLRDQQLPMAQLIQRLGTARSPAGVFGRRGEEASGRRSTPSSALENSFKVWYGQQGALTDPAFMAGKRQRRGRAARARRRRSGPGRADRRSVEPSWRASRRPRPRPVPALSPAGGRCRRRLAGCYELRPHPCARRRGSGPGRRGRASPEFTDARLPAIAAPGPERRQGRARGRTDLPGILAVKTREYLTVDNAASEDLCWARKAPRRWPTGWSRGTTLDDPAVRAGAVGTPGLEAIEASNDPLIEFALRNRRRRAGRADRLGARGQRADGPPAAERVAQARFAVYGANLYPDATFTLRLSYGKVAGLDLSRA